MKNAYRAIVNSQPQPIYTADVPTHIHIFVPMLKPDGQRNSVVYIDNEPIQIPLYGLQMPIDYPYQLLLEPKETLWAASDGEAMITLSCFPQKA